MQNILKDEVSICQTATRIATFHASLLFYDDVILRSYRSSRRYACPSAAGAADG